MTFSTIKPLAREIAAQRKRNREAKRMQREGAKIGSSAVSEQKNGHKQSSAAAQAGQKRTKLKQSENDYRWSQCQRIVRERDRYTCRWSHCEFKSKLIDVHHINERSQRPDLKFDPDNCACLCGRGSPSNHHDLAHHSPIGRAQAKALGLLGGETYEKARKESAS